MTTQLRQWVDDAKGTVAGPRGLWFNRAFRLTHRPIFWVSQRVRVVGLEHVDRPGGYLLAANHHNAMDIPGLMYITPRLIEFVSTLQITQHPLVGPFYRRFQPIPLNRGIVDSRTLREVVRRLQAGRGGGIFPEGRLCPEEESVTNGGGHRPGLGRIARLAGVPIVPAAILDAGSMMRPTAWLPLKRNRFAVAFGEPLWVRRDLEPREAQQELEARWRAAVMGLAAELKRG